MNNANKVVLIKSFYIKFFFSLSIYLFIYLLRVIFRQCHILLLLKLQL